METCPMCAKKAKRSEEEIRTLTNRLSRIEGQIRGIKKMIEDNVYCPEIITQVSAAQNALNSLNKELISSHIHSCVYEDVSAGNEASLDELTALLQKLMR